MKLADQMALAQEQLRLAEEALAHAEKEHRAAIDAAEERERSTRAARDAKEGERESTRKRAAQELGVSTPAFRAHVIAWAGLKPDEEEHGRLRGKDLIGDAVRVLGQSVVEGHPSVAKFAAEFQELSKAWSEAYRAKSEADQPLNGWRRAVMRCKRTVDEIQDRIDKSGRKAPVRTHDEETGAPITPADRARHVEARRKLDEIRDGVSWATGPDPERARKVRFVWPPKGGA
jgi:hypothetical protein